VTDSTPVPATPVEPRLRLEFTYEFEDFADAQTAASTVTVKPLRWFRGVFGWVLFVGLAVMLFMLMEHRQRTAASRPLRVPPRVAAPANNWVNDILIPVVPWLVVFGFIWFFVFRQIRRGGTINAPRPQSMLYEPGKEPPAPPERKEAERGSSMAWALLVLPVAAAIVALGMVFQRRGGGPEPVRILLPILPWVVIFLVIWFFVFRSMRGGLRAQFEAQPALHRPQVAEVYDDRIVFSDSVGRYEHAWDAFTHVRETPGTFLLFTSQYALNILPKRVFPGREAIDAFRELIRRTIAQRPSPAFPVVPAR
jgi:hypothetical protein